MQGAPLNHEPGIAGAAGAGLHAGPGAAGTKTRVYGDVLGRIGALTVRLAIDEEEIAAAQDVRYKVFYAERGRTANEGRDADRFDAVCDHLLVLDTARPGSDRERIVGTYRLLPQERAAGAGGFYTEGEFSLASLVARHPERRFLELGRSCVMPEYRTKRTIELLWQGIWAYCRRHGIDVMTGCASFPGTVPAAHAEALSFLHHSCRAEGEWAVQAHPGHARSMDLMPREAVDMRAALSAMPPLVKGYLRLGAKIGEGCVVDADFGTTDVLVILPVEAISQRYIHYYGAEAQRFAAV